MGSALLLYQVMLEDGRWLPSGDLVKIECPVCFSEETIIRDCSDNRHLYLIPIEGEKFFCPNCDSELKSITDYLYRFVRS